MPPRLAEARRLMDSPHALGACLACLDDALLGDCGAPAEGEEQQLRLMRALVLAFLGADELALDDLERAKELSPAELPHMKREVAPLAFVASAGDWHRARRQAMLRRYPAISRLFERDYSDVVKTALIVAGLCVTHLFVASRVNGPVSLVWYSATVGAFCAYGMQALTHELGHLDRQSQVAAVAGIAASSFLSFPFAMYYWQYHARHHAYTGASHDRDGDILFLAWHSPPLRLRSSPWGRWLWLGIFAFVIFPMFCHAKKELDAPHQFWLRYEGTELAMHLFLLIFLGPYALLYVLMSSAFSLGAFGHPYVHFWLTQHAFALKRSKIPKELEKLAADFHVRLCQPTLSYTGAFEPWHWLNFGELRHVEHHDWPLVPFWRMPALRALTDPFYVSLNGTESFMQALRGWLFTPSDREWMQVQGDFAGRTRHLRDLWARSDDFAFNDDVDRFIDESQEAN